MLANAVELEWMLVVFGFSVAMTGFARGIILEKRDGFWWFVGGTVMCVLGILGLAFGGHLAA